MRIEKSPSAVKSAEQWVRHRFPIELRVYRQRRLRAASALVAITDADTKEVLDRINELKNQCESMQIPFRASDEAVALVVPKRNIETWIHYLNGEQVNEKDAYPKLDQERGCKPAVNNLVGQCKSTGIKSDAPPALAAACEEYSRIRRLL
ncbi:MAG: hypothetical protein AAGU11_02995 [Syntrophobacteraceae bacterium]